MISPPKNQDLTTEKPYGHNSVDFEVVELVQ